MPPRTVYTDPSEFFNTLDQEKEIPASSPVVEAPTPAVWRERKYDSWKVSSKNSRRRAKKARQKSIREWQRKKDAES